MALVKGINSYVSVSEANAYFENRLGATAWDETDDGVKSQALVTATSILDSFDWLGLAASESQNLAFPRVGAYYDPKLGFNVSIGEGTPNRISIATIELALHLLQNPEVIEDSGFVKALSVSGISLSDIRSPNKIPGNVRSLINPLLSNSGAKLWWRSN